MNHIKESIYNQTPYLFLSGPAVDLFKKIRKESPSIEIRISTNSLAATDSWYVYALSHKQKKIYLDNLKFIICEIKPYPEDINTFIPTYQQLRNRPFGHQKWNCKKSLIFAYMPNRWLLMTK